MVRGVETTVLLLVAVTASACTGDAPNADAQFRETVVPVLEARCAAAVCHGITQEERAAGAVLPEGSFIFAIDDHGQIVDLTQARDAAVRVANVADGPDFSTLLRKPLGDVWGGLPHQGGDNFTSPRDPAYVAVRDWVSLLTGGGEDPEATRLTETQQYFADEVEPRLIRRGCALTNCHGPSSFVPFRIDPGLLTEDGKPRLSREMTLANYEQVRPFLSLDGDALQSRVIRKALPISEGGIVHRGGNDNFFTDIDAPAVEALVTWVELEQRAAIGETALDVGGLLFIRGPIGPAGLHDPSGFVPGRDLFLLEGAANGGKELNLTEKHHSGPADIRDPDASPDSTHVVFSMRKSEEDGHFVYELDLEDGTLTALTSGPSRTPSNRVVADLHPLYGPDGYVYFTSNRHDVMAERRDALDFDIYRVPRVGGDPERLTFTPSPELAPALFRVGSLHDYIVFSNRRAVDARDETVGFSFPVDRHVDYHIFFGLTSGANVVHQFEEMPDGRAAAIVADSGNVWEGGQLVIIDRNLGPDVPPGLDPSDIALPAFAQTLRIVDPAAARDADAIGLAYRDPVAAPDGSLFVSRTKEPLDLSDPASAPDYEIVRVEVSAAGRVCGSRGCFDSPFESLEVLADTPGVSEFDPEPLFRWAAAGVPRDALDEDAPTLFSMSDVSVNDGIMADLAPVSKQFRDDVKYVRFVEAVTAPPDASTPGRGRHMPARILGEVELADDGSVFVEVPPNTPFRTQLLDKDRMSVGVQHNRWLFAWPGQHFKQSSPRQFYDQVCGGCHGARSGDPQDLPPIPQITTSATVTLSRYSQANPRLPLEPQRLDDSTRITMSFADVQAILDRSCATSECHLDLRGTATDSFTVAYETLVPAYVDTDGGRARSSRLIEIASQRELDAPGDAAEHPPVDLAAEDLLALVRWVELGSPFRVPE